jgi:hypothetical protein
MRGVANISDKTGAKQKLGSSNSDSTFLICYLALRKANYVILDIPKKGTSEVILVLVHLIKNP